MMRRVTAALACAATLANVQPAHAQGFVEDLLSADAFEPFQGTARYERVVQSGLGYAPLYIALGELEQNVFYSLLPKDGAAASMNVGQVFGAGLVPGRCVASGLGCEDGDLVQYPVDMLTGAFAFGMKSGRFGFFYAGSVSTPTTFNDNASRTYRSALAYPISLGLQAAGAVFLGREDEVGLGKPQRDWLMGGIVDAEAVQIRMGYVRSANMLVNVSRPEQGLTASAVFDDGFSQLAYVNAGVDRLDWTQMNAAAAGTTTLLGRQLQYFAPIARGVGDEEAQLENARVSHWTVRFEQQEIAHYVDVGYAHSFTPSAGVHQILGAVHTKDFNRAVYGAVRGGSDDLDWAGAKFSGGLLRMPEMPYLGVEPSSRISLGAEALLTGGDGVNATASLRYNDPGAYELYPWAKDSFTFMINAVLSPRRQ